MLLPVKSFLLCEKIDTEEDKGKIYIAEDKKKTIFKKYKVLGVGEEITEYYKVGDLIIVDEEQVNHFRYDNKPCYFISDNFVVCKETK